MLNEADVARLDVALGEAIRVYADRAGSAVGPLSICVLIDPVGAVRTAYVLARDLAEVEFEDFDDMDDDDEQCQCVPV
jgi:hypothetical protein